MLSEGLHNIDVSFEQSSLNKRSGYLEFWHMDSMIVWPELLNRSVFNFVEEIILVWQTTESSRPPDSWVPANPPPRGESNADQSPSEWNARQSPPQNLRE